MTELRPFFTYFGGKWRSAPKYPRPIYDTIVEPFAGSAGYALRYPDRKVILVEKSEPIAGIWRYLIGVSEREILALPLLESGQSVDGLDICQEARWLIGMWLNKGSAAPCKIPSAWMRGGTHPTSYWGKEIRAIIAAQLARIRHWSVTCGDYTVAPDVEATWFVDPPYEGMGRHYPCGSAAIDFAHLAGWCRNRRGQAIVCEQRGAAWMPFADFGAFKATPSSKQTKRRSAEALWMNAWPGSALWLPAPAA
jgi:hypothetical protein